MLSQDFHGVECFISNLFWEIIGAVCFRFIAFFTSRRAKCFSVQERVLPRTLGQDFGWPECFVLLQVFWAGKGPPQLTS